MYLAHSTKSFSWWTHIIQIFIVERSNIYIFYCYVGGFLYVTWKTRCVNVCFFCCRQILIKKLLFVEMFAVDSLFYKHFMFVRMFAADILFFKDFMLIGLFDADRHSHIGFMFMGVFVVGSFLHKGFMFMGCSLQTNSYKGFMFMGVLAADRLA